MHRLEGSFEQLVRPNATELKRNAFSSPPPSLHCSELALQQRTIVDFKVRTRHPLTKGLQGNFEAVISVFARLVKLGSIYCIYQFIR